MRQADSQDIHNDDAYFGMAAFIEVQRQEIDCLNYCPGLGKD
jgi:hypothetical protein